MKIIKSIFLLSSILLIFLISYSIANTYVGMKYEIDVFEHDEYAPIGIAKDYILQLISTLKFFLCYVIINTVLMLISVIHKKKN